MHKYEDGCEHVRDYAVLKHEKFTTEQHTEKDTKLDDSCHTEHGSRRLRAAHTEEEAQRLQRPVTEHANRISTAAQRHTGEMGTTTQRQIIPHPEIPAYGSQRPATEHANEILSTAELESSQFEPEDKTTAKENVEAKWITYRTILGWGQTAAQRHKIIWHGGTK
ncbi:hypothetical protein R3P38DRAFT_2793717 [Favolaschia claudopus]|uniref:Uncharacterized protein n=1 Tax=Favolaschia claudopus TaxID=2862362 RepID=A0AAW0ABH5_9AGAR